MTYPPPGHQPPGDQPPGDYPPPPGNYPPPASGYPPPPGNYPSGEYQPGGYQSGGYQGGGYQAGGYQAGGYQQPGQYPPSAPKNTLGTVALVAREDGVVAGLRAGLMACQILDPSVTAHIRLADGSRVAPGDEIALVTDAEDSEERMVGGLRVVPYLIPRGCIASYYPECNPLIPVAHHAVDSHVPAAKSIPVRISRRTDAPVPAGPAPH